MVADSAGGPNFPNRTLWIDDNLRVLRGINSECVDLIYLDPPFNTQRLYNAPLGSSAAGAKFDDTWTLDGVKSEWAELQEAADPAMHHTVVGAGLSAGESMQAYLCFMALRLQECHRILKPTGSIYLHCDPTASHYVKQLLDCIFGQTHFQNEVVWCYRGMPAKARKWQAKHDVILFYMKSPKATFHVLRGEPTAGTRRTHASAMRRGYNTNLKKKMVTVFDRAKYEQAVADGTIPAGLNESEFSGGRPPMRDWWEDIKILGGPKNKERTGWPTQKPLALLERIIKASSNPGDVVLDPFCGCATAMVAAERLERHWAGIDIDETAVGITLKRLQDESDAAVHNVDLDGLREGLPAVHLPHTPPLRTDPDRPTRSPRIRAIRWHELGTGARRPCPGCRRRKYFDDFDLDHITPRAKGGLDADDNLQLLCSSCNRIKGSALTMTELRQRLLTDTRHRPPEEGDSPS